MEAIIRKVDFLQKDEMVLSNINIWIQLPLDKNLFEIKDRGTIEQLCDKYNISKSNLDFNSLIGKTCEVEKINDNMDFKFISLI